MPHWILCLKKNPNHLHKFSEAVILCDFLPPLWTECPTTWCDGSLPTNLLTFISSPVVGWEQTAKMTLSDWRVPGDIPTSQFVNGTLIRQMPPGGVPQIQGMGSPKI